MSKNKNENENESSLTLAITTIGNLLLENHISRQIPEGNSIEVTLCIPNYQRPYKWTVRNVFRLVDDIIEAKYENQKTYRVGTLILHHDPNKQNEYDIVDGQQRVISFCLLLKALASKLNEKEPGAFKEPEFLKKPIEPNPYTVRNLVDNYHALCRKIGNIPNHENFWKYVTERKIL